MLNPETKQPPIFDVITGGRSPQEFHLDSKEAIRNLKQLLCQFYKVYIETRRDYGFGPDTDFIVREEPQITAEKPVPRLAIITKNSSVGK